MTKALAGAVGIFMLLALSTPAAEAFSPTELDEITEHLYRGGANRPITGVGCGTRCRRLWEAEQERMAPAPWVGALHAELFVLRQRVALLPYKSEFLPPLAESKTTLGFVLGRPPRQKWIGVVAPPYVTGSTGTTITTGFLRHPKDTLSHGGGWELKAPSLGWTSAGPSSAKVFDFRAGTPSNGCTASGPEQGLYYGPWTILEGPVTTMEHLPCGFSGSHLELPFWAFQSVRPDGSLFGPIEDYNDQPVTEAPEQAVLGSPQTWTDMRTRVETELQSRSDLYPTLLQWYAHQLDGTQPLPDDSRYLAERFRPILRFDSREPWRPLNVERFFEEDFGGERHEVCLVDWDELVQQPDTLTYRPARTCEEITSWEKLREYRQGVGQGDTEQWPVVRIHGDGDDVSNFASPRLGSCLSSEIQDCDTGANTAMYYRFSGPHPESNYRFIDYWVFYRFNKFDGESIPGAPAGDHEGDWEHITVAIEPDGLPDTFEWVGLSGHHDAHFRYLREVLRCGDNLAAGSCGSEAGARWGQRVVSFVSNGSHANYPEWCQSPIGAAVCPQSSAEGHTYIPPEKGYDGLRPWGGNEDPDTLIAFPASLNGWGSSGLSGDHWATWPGRWGLFREAHTSVSSPGSPDRATFFRPWAWDCSERGTDETVNCDTTGLGAAPVVSDAASSSDGGCEAWSGPGVAVSWCDPVALAEAMRAGTLGKATDASVQIDGHDAPSAATSAVAQVAGAALDADEAIRIEGRVPEGSVIRVRLEDGGEPVIAEFSPSRRNRRGLQLRFQRKGDERSLVLKTEGTTQRPRFIEP